MELVVIALLALTCSAVMSILAFMTGRCGRKLPIDGMLPHVVHSAYFNPKKDTPRPAPEPARPTWPYADWTLSTTPRTADAPPPQNSNLCATIDATETDAESAQAATCAPTMDSTHGK